MTLGGDVITPDLYSLEHWGVEGMKWGIRKAKAQKALYKKNSAQGKADRQKFRLAHKLHAGEVVVSGLLGGPIGVLGYKLIKRHAAVVKRRNQNLSDEDQINAASKISLGEALVVSVISSPVGLIPYGIAKYAAANMADEF